MLRRAPSLLSFDPDFRVMVKFRTSSAFRRWVRVRVLGYGFGVRGRKVKSRDCALASDLVRADQSPSSRAATRGA